MSNPIPVIKTSTQQAEEQQEIANEIGKLLAIYGKLVAEDALRFLTIVRTNDVPDFYTELPRYEHNPEAGFTRKIIKPERR
ncbi:hypothetical protein GF380_06670 [Candidatus Uhrbacteria bacterium]|nr:hypothetical protein [Candidatus Uhrbacteria bacterium]